jgi:tRNA threonylcarbamoyladenosine biosynthesis protein TsaB
MPPRSSSDCGEGLRMKVLGFDCAGRGCAAAVLVDGAVAASRSLPMERGQAEALIPLIESVLARAGARLAELDLIAVTVGPGGFTGLRIGLAAARGFALATGVPVIGVTSFAAVAAAVPAALHAGRTLVVALDSKRDELFLQALPASGAHDPVIVAPAGAAALLPAGPLLIAGDAAMQLAPALGGRARIVAGDGLPDPADVARLGRAAWQPGTRPELPRPLYLRAPDTTLARHEAVP